MSGQIHLYPQEHWTRDGFVRAAARLEFPDRSAQTLWYEVPEAYRPALSRTCNPFVVGTIMRAMLFKQDLVVHGQVSPSLLRNLDEFQDFCAALHPDQFTPIEITADVEQETAPANGRAILAFSGGLDSTFTVWRHCVQKTRRPRQNLTAALMTEGFDIPLVRTQDFERAFARAKCITDGAGIELVRMRTNFRQLRGDWLLTYGAGAASALMMLEGGFGVGLLGGTPSYRYPDYDMGSNPVSDPLLSSDAFKVLGDGLQYTRTQKAGLLSSWQPALENIRVCWQGAQFDRNCGHCQKCVRTILNFKAAGAPVPPCFPNDVTWWDILARGPVGKIKHEYYQDILEAARANHISDSWVWLLRGIMPVYGVLLKIIPPDFQPVRRLVYNRVANS